MKIYKIDYASGKNITCGRKQRYCNNFKRIYHRFLNLYPYNAEVVAKKYDGPHSVQFQKVALLGVILTYLGYYFSVADRALS